MNEVDYCLKLARESAYPEYLCMLMLPPEARRSVLPLIALDAELRQIGAKVSEEMVAHIRFAWWRESVQPVLAGEKPREHPVIKAIAGISGGQLTYGRVEPMIDAAQEAWPKMDYPGTALHEAIASLLEGKAAQTWKRSLTVTQRHRQKHGSRKKPLMALKLLFSR